MTFVAVFIMVKERVK